METQESPPTMPTVLFREIHKNSFLKRLSSDRRTGFPRRSERVWVVFCVHDDKEAFLELYPDHKVALAHKPDWFISLHNALHVSPSIVGQGDEFEFAVTLPTQVVRLAASSWDSMMGWVDTMRNKLRELRVLAPKENLYSKMPEPRHLLLPTRDPTSPLPLPPVGPSGLLPGVENPRPSGSASSPPPLSDDLLNGASRGALVRESYTPPPIIRNIPNDASRGRLATVANSPIRVDGTESSGEPHLMNDFSRAPVSNFRLDSSSSYTPILGDRKKDKPLATAVSPGSSVVVVNDDSDLLPCNQRPPAALPDTDSDSNSPVEPIVSPIGKNFRRLVRAASVPSASNVTVIEVPPPTSSHYEHLFLSEAMPSSDSRTKLERVSSSGLIPRLPAKVPREPEARVDKVAPNIRGIDRHSPLNNLESEENLTTRLAGPSLSVQQKDSLPHTSVVTVKSQETTVQMAVKIPPKQTAVVHVENPTADSSPIPSVVPGTSGEHVRETVEVVPPLPAAFQPAPSGLNVRDIPLIGGHQRRRRRSSSSDAGPVMRGLVGADLIRIAPAEAPEAPVDAPRRTLRETQVCQLRREMSHPGGVRLPLRRKDCVGAIALVDVSNAVWVAGWKQREHPMLYNALHIGDRVVSVGDVPVRTAGDAQKLLRGVGGPTVELVVRRLPLGVILALQRPRGGGDVGLVPDANASAEVNVVPGGAAARSGLPPRTATMDGLSLTTWTLTEINGRPLNLFCKPNEVTTRLNSVGKELSVLVQPSDFIKQVRKQLKAMRGYKEYLLL